LAIALLKKKGNLNKVKGGRVQKSSAQPRGRMKENGIRLRTSIVSIAMVTSGEMDITMRTWLTTVTAMVTTTRMVVRRTTLMRSRRIIK